MVSKWRILRQPIIGNPDTIDKIVKAIGVLHNFLREKEGTAIEQEMETEQDQGLHNVRGRLGPNMYSSAAENVRGSFAEYFSSPQGSVPFQHPIVNRGRLN